MDFRSLERLDQLDRLATLLDDRFTIPGTDWRVGIDAIIGLIPGVGDLAGAAMSTYIIWKARQLGASRWAQSRMAGNILIETTIGAIPVIGDIFDARWKANRRNLRILRKNLAKRGRPGEGVER